MKTVKFVKALVVEKRPLIDPNSFKYHINKPLSRIRGYDAFIPTESIEECVPIHYFSKTTRREDLTQPEGYRYGAIETVVAYSKEVQELLEMPFDIMHEKIEALRSENRNLQDYNNGQHKIIKDLNAELKSLKSSFFARLKFLFKPN